MVRSCTDAGASTMLYFLTSAACLTCRHLDLQDCDSITDSGSATSWLGVTRVVEPGRLRSDGRRWGCPR